MEPSAETSHLLSADDTCLWSTATQILVRSNMAVQILKRLKFCLYTVWFRHTCESCVRFGNFAAKRLWDHVVSWILFQPFILLTGCQSGRPVHCDVTLSAGCRHSSGQIVTYNVMWLRFMSDVIFYSRLSRVYICTEYVTSSSVLTETESGT